MQAVFGNCLPVNKVIVFNFLLHVANCLRAGFRFDVNSFHAGNSFFDWINILNAEKMLKVYEQQNVLWRIENAEFSHLVKIYGSSLSYTTQASLFLLWRKNEFQNLIQKYVS